MMTKSSRMPPGIRNALSVFLLQVGKGQLQIANFPAIISGAKTFRNWPARFGVRFDPSRISPNLKRLTFSGALYLRASGVWTGIETSLTKLRMFD